jgi:hypothetical protein
MLIGGLFNATPSLGELCPMWQEPVDDEIVGSGREIDAGEQQRTARRPGRASGRATKTGDPPPDTMRAIAAITAARGEVSRSEPDLGLALSREISDVRRDDIVGTMIRDGDTIWFNQAYVMSLSPSELQHHLWQVAVSLAGPW